MIDISMNDRSSGPSPLSPVLCVHLVENGFIARTLLVLHFHRSLEFVLGVHLDRNTLLQECSKYARIGPVQFPAFLDSQQAVASWNDIEQQETAVGIALVAPEENLVVLCIL